MGSLLKYRQGYATLEKFRNGGEKNFFILGFRRKFWNGTFLRPSSCGKRGLFKVLFEFPLDLFNEFLFLDFPPA